MGAHTGGRGRAPTRGAPTGCWQPEEVLVAGGCSCPGRSVGQSHLNSDAKIVYEGARTRGEGRAPTRGAPTGGFFWGAHAKGGGVRTRGVRTGGFLGRAHQGGRAPTRGVRTGGFFWGAHAKGGRVRTRGVRTGCWQPEEVLSLARCSCQGGSVGQSHLKGCPYAKWVF